MYAASRVTEDSVLCCFILVLCHQRVSVPSELVVLVLLIWPFVISGNMYYDLLHSGDHVQWHCVCEQYATVCLH